MTKIEEQLDFKEKNKNSDVLYLKQELENEKLLWEQVKLAISNDVRAIIWKAWIEPLEFIKYKNSMLHLSAPSYLISSRAETQYYETIFLQASKMFENLKKIRILKDTPEKIIHKEKSKNNNQVLTSKINIKSNDEVSFLTSAAMQLNTKFTFDNFVVGRSNEMPYAVSKRVSESMSTTYNPIYLYGQVGLGKTHLLNAIAIDLKEKFPNLKIVLMSAERFMYQFIKAIRLRDTIRFKDQFRSVDVLMIDDIQFIGGKGSTQEEFFYTFNDLIDQRKQIIITSNKPPVELTDLDEKLKSRLGGGLVVDFLPTNFDLRIDILNKKVQSLSLSIPNEVLEFLANKIDNNIRELEGALNRICANHDLTGRAITIENAEELLSDLLQINEKKISIALIQQQVSLYFNLKVSEMGSPRRSINIARPRQIAMYLCKEMTSFSYPEIGKAFGGKDHTTVMHAVKKIEALSIADLQLKKDLIDLRKLIRSN
jgi:chromosomal replication initiator protein